MANEFLDLFEWYRDRSKTGKGDRLPLVLGFKA
jgi:hypothetical protein